MTVEGADAIEHFRLLDDLANSCTEKGIAIYEHRYHYLAFGSWTIVAGRRKNRMRFDWNGKEKLLYVSQSEFPDSQAPANWTPLPCDTGGDGITQAEVIIAVQKYLRGVYDV